MSGSSPQSIDTDNGGNSGNSGNTQEHAVLASTIRLCVVDTVCVGADRCTCASQCTAIFPTRLHWQMARRRAGYD